MRISFFITLTLELAIAFHPALAITIKCPDKINTSQSLQEKVNGWDEFLDDWNIVHHFNKVTFYAGHPKEHASLVPDNEDTKSNKMNWTFGKDIIWLACGYSNTDIQLIQKLPNATTTCSVTYDSNFSKNIAINCI
ncbi:MAG: hypothetical protein HYX60_02130 [Legionella longbeachae]|nr:hypothetical protein [Legionella longbeachae]